MIDKTGKLIDRRQNRPDILVKLIHWLGIAVWLLMIGVFIITDRSRPESPTIFDRIFNVQLRTSWDLHLMRYAFLLMIIVFMLSSIGLFINTKRHQRKDDRYSLSLITMGALSIMGIILCTYYFWL